MYMDMCMCMHMHMHMHMHMSRVMQGGTHTSLGRPQLSLALH